MADNACFGLPYGMSSKGSCVLSQPFHLFSVFGNDVPVIPAGFEAGRCEFGEEDSVRTGFGFRTGCAFSSVCFKPGVCCTAVAKICFSQRHIAFWSGLNLGPCGKDG